MSANWTEAEFAEAQQRLGRTVPKARRFPAGHDGEPRASAADSQNARAAAAAVNSGPGRGAIAGDVRVPCRHSRPEEALQIAIVAHWRPKLAADVRLLALNGELPGGKEQARRAGRRKAMGYMRGTPDLGLLHGGRAYFMELKAKGSLSYEQKNFRTWCRFNGFGYEVVKSVEQAGEWLAAWRLLQP